MNNSAPIIITSPVRRSGTTLIQRLLSSSTNCLIFGESSARDLQMYANLLMSKQLQYLNSKELRDLQISSVLKGNVNDWIPDLLPEVDFYIEQTKQSLLGILNSFQEYANQHQRPIWGMKLPEWTPSNLILGKQFYPELKVVYIERNIADCIRSAKQVNMIQNIGEVDQFCQAWKTHVDMAKQHFDEKNTLYISYESLIENPESILNELESFTGAHQIDRSVLEAKFNTYKAKMDDENDETVGRYVEPSELSEEELEIVKKYI